MTDQDQPAAGHSQPEVDAAGPGTATEQATAPSDRTRPPGALTSLDALFGGTLEGGASCSTDGVCD